MFIWIEDTMIVDYYKNEKQHIESLCKEYNIKYDIYNILGYAAHSNYEYCNAYSQHLYGQSKRITGPEINCLDNYIIMLHEIGHIVYDKAQSHICKTVTERLSLTTPNYLDPNQCEVEARAWEWAILNSRITLCQEFLYIIKELMGSYANILETKDIYKQLIRPQSGIFWSLLLNW